MTTTDMSDQATFETKTESPAANAESTEDKSLLEVALDGAIALAKDSKNTAQAHTQFEALLRQVEADSPTVAPLLKQLWKEYMSAQRSAAFFESLSDAEKDLSDKMSASTIQLKQNYMRLVQEQ